MRFFQACVGVNQIRLIIVQSYNEHKYNLFYIKYNSQISVKIDSLSCPNGMIGREKTCYAVSVTEADAVSAREACQAVGADLVWMDTAEEQTWLIGVVRKAFQDLKFKHWHIGESQGQLPL